ncbi:30S ribosomal protein S8 [Limihaloglobus sulfuriphilus]|uniref:Small ribosomal subunit protein uS8 n=1 Tax=Limihaloglobus sulfuriphilus TaxID=1851148 RepID=A0A1Q2MIF5_9BACT|nr:30S ribosomal protein S8 [Limihaloglobus sulfuriphilus]AQQ72042.1 30S ribosomal protein S8 [Limihaloglobus sulfuriphilus]
MSLNDPIADMLTRIRNASSTRKSQVMVKSSKVCKGVATVLKEEGYIVDFDIIDDGKQGLIRVMLKYTPDGGQAITDISRVSTPGKRVYSNVEDMPKVLGGLGINIVTTNRGVMSDRQCREQNIGGEILCSVS